MLTAVAYVWPTSPLQQLRAALCVVLLGAMRLLNLAVPILYRDVVNTFRRGSPCRSVSTSSCNKKQGSHSIWRSRCLAQSLLAVGHRCCRFCGPSQCSNCIRH